MMKTIIFDLSEVYLQGLLGAHRLIAKKLEIPVSHSELTGQALDDLFHGRITEEDYWRSIIELHGWRSSIDELKRIVRENFIEIEGTRTIIEKLKTKGYRLGLLSVHAREWVEYCEDKFDYHRLFDSVMYSFEVEVCKPDRHSFLKILEALKVRPEECLFIDDMERNILAAAKLGIKVIRFVSAQQLETELKKFGIL